MLIVRFRAVLRVPAKKSGTVVAVTEDWHSEFVEIPEHLRPVLRMYGQERAFAVAEAMAAELHLSTKNLSGATQRLMLALIEPLEHALSEGSRFLENRPMGIAEHVAKGMSLNDILRVLLDIGGGPAMLQTNVRLDELHSQLAKLLMVALMPKIQDAMLRWDKRGLFAA